MKRIIFLCENSFIMVVSYFKNLNTYIIAPTAKQIKEILMTTTLSKLEDITRDVNFDWIMSDEFYGSKTKLCDGLDGFWSFLMDLHKDEKILLQKSRSKNYAERKPKNLKAHISSFRLNKTQSQKRVLINT